MLPPRENTCLWERDPSYTSQRYMDNINTFAGWKIIMGGRRWPNIELGGQTSEKKNQSAIKPLKISKY